MPGEYACFADSEYTPLTWSERQREERQRADWRVQILQTTSPSDSDSHYGLAVLQNLKPLPTLSLVHSHNILKALLVQAGPICRHSKIQWTAENQAPKVSWELNDCLETYESTRCTPVASTRTRPQPREHGQHPGRPRGASLTAEWGGNAETPARADTWNVPQSASGNPDTSPHGGSHARALCPRWPHETCPHGAPSIRLLVPSGRLDLPQFGFARSPRAHLKPNTAPKTDFVYGTLTFESPSHQIFRLCWFWVQCLFWEYIPTTFALPAIRSGRHLCSRLWRL